MVFLDDFLQWVEALRKERPNLIISGDYNLAHTDIDINFPKKHQKMSGFLPEERAWVDQYLTHGYVDTFRMFHSEPSMYSWWSYRQQARAKNLGWRIDYHTATRELAPRIKDASILPNVEHSDHCPVTVTVDF
jgi:exodeoxyribonuclease-3